MIGGTTGTGIQHSRCENCACAFLDRCQPGGRPLQRCESSCSAGIRLYRDFRVLIFVTWCSNMFACVLERPILFACDWASYQKPTFNSHQMLLFSEAAVCVSTCFNHAYDDIWSSEHDWKMLKVKGWWQLGPTGFARQTSKTLCDGQGHGQTEPENKASRRWRCVIQTFIFLKELTHSKTCNTNVIQMSWSEHCESCYVKAGLHINVACWCMLQYAAHARHLAKS
jgi:hypothetical protein